MHRFRQIGVEHAVHLRLIVEEVHLAGGAVHVQVDGALRLGSEMGEIRQTPNARGVALRARRRQESGKRGGADANGAATKKVSSREGRRILFEWIWAHIKLLLRCPPLDGEG
jgi:hypothetical protein